MAKVFISHASADGDAAQLVHEWLVADGHQVFLDHDLLDGIELGEEWEQRLHERLRWAEAVVCLVTSAYIDSAWCTAELGVARSRGSRLLPISVEPALTHPLLPSLQYADLSDPTATRTLLAKALLGVGGAWPWPDGRPPFPGLDPFDVDLHQVFFGRQPEVEELVELLRSPAERARGAALFLVGPSGCGKSSLVRAGLLPAMADEPGWWCLPPIVPGRQPVQTLLREIAGAARDVGLSWTASDVRRRVEDGGLAETVDDLLLQAGGGRRRLLVVVDQFEELLTRGNQAERGRFAELLEPALGRSVHLVVTLRPEFLEPLLAAPELSALSKRVHPIQPLRPEALRAVVVEPTRSAGLHIDDDLVDRLVADTEDGKALPLLAYTLARLAAGLRRGGRLLESRYDELGGVQGTLVGQADTALAEAVAAGGRTQDHVVRELLRLVTVDQQDRPARWRVPRDELSESAATELEPFVERRLLTTDSENDRPVITVAHEAFLSAWPPLRDAIARTSTALRARSAVEQAADRWEQEGRAPARLWERGQLASALADTGARVRRHAPRSPAGPTEGDGGAVARSRLVSDQVELNTRARDFLLAGVRRDRRRRNRSVTILSALLVLALVAAGYAVRQQGVAEDQQLIATSRQLLAQADVARATDPRLALLLGVAASHLTPGPAADSNLVDTLTHTRYARTLAHGSDVVSVAVAPNGRILATGGIDGTVGLWDVADPAHAVRIGQPLTGHSGFVYSVAFAPDGRTVASAGADHTVLVWDVTDPTHAHRIGEPLTGHTDGVHAVAFAPRGNLLASAGFDRTVRLWDVTDPARARPVGAPLTGHGGVVADLAFSPDGTTMATASFDKTVLLWDVRDSAAPRRLGEPLTGHANAVWSVAFAPDGRTLAGGSGDGTTLLWDISDPTRPQAFPALRTSRAGQVYAVAFAPGGHVLATAGADRTVTLWDVTRPAAPVVSDELVGQTNTVYSVAFSPEGHTLISGGADRTAVVWNLDGPPQPRLPGEPAPGIGAAVNTVALASDGRTAATAGTGRVDLWDVTGAAQPQHVGEPLTWRTTVWSVAFSPDGRTLAGAGDDGTVRLWDVTDRARPRPAAPLTGLGGAVYALAFSPDGRMMATAGADRRIRLWDLTDPAGPRPIGGGLSGHTGPIYALAFSPDGRTLGSSAADNAVILWDVTDTGAPRMRGAPLPGHTGPVYSVAFAAGAPLAASASADGSVILWDVREVDHPRALGRPLLGHSGAVYRVAFAADGRTLASAGADGHAVLWDLSDEDRPRALGPPLTAHAGAANGVQFVAGTSRLATTGIDGMLRLWNLGELNAARDRPAAAACAITGRGLDEGEWAGYIPGLGYENTCPG